MTSASSKGHAHGVHITQGTIRRFTTLLARVPIRFDEYAKTDSGLGKAGSQTCFHFSCLHFWRFHILGHTFPLPRCPVPLRSPTQNSKNIESDKTQDMIGIRQEQNRDSFVHTPIQTPQVQAHNPSLRVPFLRSAHLFVSRSCTSHVSMPDGWLSIHPSTERVVLFRASVACVTSYLA